VTALAAYEAGLDGQSDCWLHTPGGGRRRLPLRRWMADADEQDAAVVASVLGTHPTMAGASLSVLDIGCGPGRLTAALSRAGCHALGLDISARAVEITRARGGLAVQGDVFGPVTGTGEWHRVLLADGNLGIGGDPVRLLARAAQLLAPGGAVVADVERAGGIWRGTAWLESGRDHVDGSDHLDSLDHPDSLDRLGGPLPWAWVGAAAVPALAAATGLTAEPVRHLARRSIAIWHKSAEAQR
jgi:SAM-dependent methyltransferase